MSYIIVILVGSLLDWLYVGYLWKIEWENLGLLWVNWEDKLKNLSLNN